MNKKGSLMITVLKIAIVLLIFMMIIVLLSIPNSFKFKKECREYCADKYLNYEVIEKYTPFIEHEIECYCTDIKTKPDLIYKKGDNK